MFAANAAFAADFFVASAADISAITPSLGPGDTVTLQNGTWTNQQIQFNGNGTSSLPITLRAETPGQVVLNGSSSLNISGDWLIADGLNFDGGALGASDHVVEFRGSNGEATNSRLTNSAITNYNPADINTRYFWVSLYGSNNRVDNNSFSGQNHSGVTVTVWRNSSAADNHLIDNNYFANRPQGNANGFETIRVGTSAESLSSSFTTVENNLFEATDGEIEIISNKSGNNTFRYNTFRESAGTLTLRHGDNNLVEGNFFLGEGKNQTGGVRVIGENQTILNNYFEGLDGRAGGAISISAAVPNTPLNGYVQVKDVVIAHNTIVNLADRAAITFDDGLGSNDRTLLAEDVTIANNLIRSFADPLFEGNEGSGWTWEGNIAFGQSLGPATGNPGIQVVDPQLVLGADGLWRPGPESPAIDAASGNYSSLASVDVDGQPRIGLLDIGADEFSSASIVRRPLEPGDVGHDWTAVPVDPPVNPPAPVNPPTPLPTVDGVLAIQSDDYARILDPNGDGGIWELRASPDSLGGFTMVAPSGDRINLPGTHDTILVYDLEFSEAGEYTAYYRARGSNSGSDSLFTPDDFGVDPDNNESLSNNGLYRWETGGEFEITDSDTGVPLEFRIGRRERLADFDAFVLHPSSNLSAAELDALFLIDSQSSIDFNEDGLVDCADLNALAIHVADGGIDLAFDVDGDGVVDQSDLGAWLSDAATTNEVEGYLPGDANLDGSVDSADFDVWNTNRFSSSSSPCLGDFNLDGIVDVSDLNLWNTHRGTASASTTVPEPSSGCWVFCVLLAYLIRGPQRTRFAQKS